MSGPCLEVSVLLPTYNRGPLLKEALESLFRQTIDPKSFEVIVVDNGSTDGTEEMIAEIRERAPFEIVYRRMERNGGCLRSWNLSAEMARAGILASIDSDCIADPDWLRRGLEAFHEDSELGFVAGYIADKPGQPVTFFSLRNGAPKGENVFYPAGNLFYRRSVYLAMGGYDENLCIGGRTSMSTCADSDLAWRIRKAGYRHRYCPDAVVYHEVKTVPPMVWLKAHCRISAVPLLIRQHPELRSVLTWKIFFFPVNALFYLLSLGVVLAIVVHPAALLLGVPFLVQAGRSPHHFSVLRVPRMAARVAMLSLRQAVICSSLIYGSLRAGSIVL